MPFVKATLRSLLLLVLAAGQSAVAAPLDEQLSSGLKTLHIELAVSKGVRTIWSLHPTKGSSSDYETESAQTVVRIVGSITEQTPSGYRVTFERIVTKPGAPGKSEKEVVTFPFGRNTQTRLFDSLEIIAFYSNPKKKE